MSLELPQSISQVLNLITNKKEKKANEKEWEGEGQNHASNQQFLGGDTHSFLPFYKPFSIFNRRVRWIEEDQKTKINKKCMRCKNKYVDNNIFLEIRRLWVDPLVGSQ